MSLTSHDKKLLADVTIDVGRETTGHGSSAPVVTVHSRGQYYWETHDARQTANALDRALKFYLEHGPD